MAKMGATKFYSVRPLIKPPIPGLEQMFNIELKKGDMDAEGIARGEAILLECPDRKAGGVGVAFLSTDLSPSTGKNNPIIKIYEPLRECFRLSHEDKCVISKFSGRGRRVGLVRVEDVSKEDNPVREEVRHAVAYWVGCALGMLN